MDIRQLQFLLAIVDQGTLGRAARHLGVTQSALSQSLARLEEYLQVALFERTSRGMVLTPYGSALVTRARTIANEAQFALEDIDGLRGLGRGHLVVGAGPALACTFVSWAITRLLLSRPRLTVSIKEGSMSSLGPAIEKGEVHLAVLSRDKSSQERQLVTEDILSESVNVVARKNHPLHKKGSLRLEDCLNYTWVLPPRPDTLRLFIDSAFTKIGLPEPRVSVESASAMTIKSFLVRGDSLGFMSHRLISLERDAGLLEPLFVEGAVWERDVQVVYSQRRSLSRTAERLIVELRQLAKQEP